MSRVLGVIVTYCPYLLSRGLYFTGISEGKTGRILCGAGGVGEYSFKICLLTANDFQLVNYKIFK